MTSPGPLLDRAWELLSAIAGGRLCIRPVLAATRRTYVAGGRSRESGTNFFDTQVVSWTMDHAECADLDVRPRDDSHFSDGGPGSPPSGGKSRAAAGRERAKPHHMRSSAIDDMRIALLPTGPDVGWVKSRQISRIAPRSPGTRGRSSTENVTFSSAWGAPSVAVTAPVVGGRSSGPPTRVSSAGRAPEPAGGNAAVPGPPPLGRVPRGRG